MHSSGVQEYMCIIVVGYCWGTHFDLTYLLLLLSWLPVVVVTITNIFINSSFRFLLFVCSLSHFSCPSLLFELSLYPHLLRILISYKDCFKTFLHQTFFFFILSITFERSLSFSFSLYPSLSITLYHFLSVSLSLSIFPSFSHSSSLSLSVSLLLLLHKLAEQLFRGSSGEVTEVSNLRKCVNKVVRSARNFVFLVTKGLSGT